MEKSTHFDLVGHDLNPMSSAYAYGTHVEIVAAAHLFNIDINLIYAGKSYPSSPPETKSFNVLYDPVAQHYSTLQYCG